MSSRIVNAYNFSAANSPLWQLLAQKDVDSLMWLKFLEFSPSAVKFPTENSERLLMSLGPSQFSHRLLDRLANSFLVFAVSLAAFFIAGCGGGNSVGVETGKTLSGYTAVTVLATSTANDRLAAFNVEFTSITLTSQSGKTVSLVSVPLFPEFIHLNGTAEPLATASIPQGVYTAATVNIGSAQFTCVSLDSSGALQSGIFADLQTPNDSVTVILPAPIIVTGTSMGLSLDLLVSKSETLGNCADGGSGTFSITPTFNVTAVTIAAQPTNFTNGKSTGLLGQIGSVDASGTAFSVAGADGAALNGPHWQVNFYGGTLFQGINSFSQLVAGMPVDMDVAIQADGSLLATRVLVEDRNVNSLNIFSGPVSRVLASKPVAFILFRQQQGHLDESSYYEGAFPVNFGNAVFQSSDRAVQSAESSLYGQLQRDEHGRRPKYFCHFPCATFPGAPLPVETVTLLPQTINGTVSAVSSSGDFATYTVMLASYDLFPNLGMQPGQTALLTNPGNVEVYVNRNTHLLNGNALAIGSLFRFNGLVFNDKGTLRMDCAEVNDGIAE